jgi:hypothetical protein
VVFDTLCGGRRKWLGVFRRGLGVFQRGLVVAGSSVRRSWVVFRQDLVVTGEAWLSPAHFGCRRRNLAVSGAVPAAFTDEA